jgi:hypothetical protein
MTGRNKTLRYKNWANVSYSHGELELGKTNPTSYHTAHLGITPWSYVSRQVGDKICMRLYPKRDLEIIVIKDRRRCSIDNRDDDTPEHAIVEHAKAVYGVRSVIIYFN